MSWVYGHYNFLNLSFSVGTVFRRNILTSKDGPRAERVKTIDNSQQKQDVEPWLMLEHRLRRWPNINPSSPTSRSQRLLYDVTNGLRLRASQSGSVAQTLCVTTSSILHTQSHL